ncbi:MAG: hypothetical protein GY819_07245 [Planctomycetaceae bacterium]|nr:hypothetical protein [Planctomycetaceae bacterium]MCP4462577.1 hypothetical protein [Planctomycetaceae bacterium]MDG1806574.1 hypothetical protein [Pirellulaceae bacterium]MDG2103613.1 hypothetical protein [Pirellulaceae bacterium]
MAGMTSMPKALCLTALVISILVFLLFFSDLLLSMTGMESAAPFRGAHTGIDIVFSVSAAILGILSFFTFREQV